MRTPLIAGNWKMHKTAAETLAFIEQLVPESRDLRGVEIVLFPSFPLLPRAADALGDATHVALGGQDLHPEPAGAHTGDTSGAQLVDAGCRWVLCGHSERRKDHGEDDDLVAAKVAAARAAGLLPVPCLGETLEERESGRTEEVLARQLDALVEAVRPLAERAVVAYEPVWAIGTGRTATAEVAQAAHRFLRQRLRAHGLAAGALRLLYGGSVKAENCEELLAEPDIDGFLIGGASLDPGSFLDIIRRCARA